MDKKQAKQILENISKYIIYDKNIKQICYSAELVEALRVARECLKEEN